MAGGATMSDDLKSPARYAFCRKAVISNRVSDEDRFKTPCWRKPAFRALNVIIQSVTKRHGVPEVNAPVESRS